MKVPQPLWIIFLSYPSVKFYYISYLWNLLENFPTIFLITAIFLGIGYLSNHFVFAYPSILANPTCGPAVSDFNVTISGSGFAPNANVNWKLVDSHNEVPLYGYFKTDSVGGFNDFTLLDQLKEDNYHMAFADDVNNDNKFDTGAPIVWADISIPCPSANTSRDLTSNPTTTPSASVGGDLILLSQKLKEGTGDYNDIIGQVKNMGSDTMDFVKIGLTVFDKNGDVIGTDSTYAASATLKPNQKSSFDIISSKDNFDGMQNYELSLQWQNSDGEDQYIDNAQVNKSNSESVAHVPSVDITTLSDSKITKNTNSNATKLPSASLKNSHTGKAKMKSYQLIVYLDNASPQNLLRNNFKIVVYNSNNEPILSAKPNIDFNDDHQKISPPKGYPIIHQSGQYPEDIRVCAQQEYRLNGTNHLHDDCYPIKQNIQKTYWYTIMDYGKIDGSVANSKSNEMTPVPATIAPDNRTSKLENILSANDPSADMIAIKMTFGKGDRPFGSIDMTIYKLKDQNFVVSNNSRICPNQNCKFEFTDTDLVYQPGSNDITLDGTLKINTDDVTKITKFSSRFQPTEAREQNGITIETVEGTFGVGKEPINSAEFTYNVNGTLVTSGKDKTLSLKGVQCTGIGPNPAEDLTRQIDCNY